MRFPRTLEQWCGEIIHAALRAPVTAAAAGAGLNAYLWLKARM